MLSLLNWFLPLPPTGTIKSFRESVFAAKINTCAYSFIFTKEID